jgi:hypothetical protein
MATRSQFDPRRFAFSISMRRSPSPRCDAEPVRALKAKERLAGLLRSGRVEIERDGRGRYGRTLARVRVASGDVGEILPERASRCPGRMAERQRRPACSIGVVDRFGAVVSLHAAMSLSGRLEGQDAQDLKSSGIRRQTPPGLCCRMPKSSGSSTRSHSPSELHPKVHAIAPSADVTVRPSAVVQTQALIASLARVGAGEAVGLGAVPCRAVNGPLEQALCFLRTVSPVSHM